MGTDNSHGNNGVFIIPAKDNPCSKGKHAGGRELCLIVSDGLGWEHVSIHAYDPQTDRTYTPYWEEMAFVKSLFWDETDVVIQYHPARKDYVNIHPNVLHMWRVPGWEQAEHAKPIPMPPIEMV